MSLESLRLLLVFVFRLVDSPIILYRSHVILCKHSGFQRSVRMRRGIHGGLPKGIKKKENHRARTFICSSRCSIIRCLGTWVIIYADVIRCFYLTVLTDSYSIW